MNFPFTLLYHEARRAKARLDRLFLPTTGENNRRKTGQGRVLSFEFSSTGQINMPRRRLSTAISLAILAVGFAGLGVLSLLMSYLEIEANRAVSETAYSVVGSATSILLGAIFFFALVLFTRTQPRESV
jgi:hypothetical protein